MKLTPEDLEKVQNKKIANVLRKLHSGKTLTAREDALLTAATAGGTIEANYVGTWDDLAAALGKAIGGTVTRRAIQDWRSDPRYQPEIARRKDLLARADGRHCVPEWLRFMVDFGLKRADEGVVSRRSEEEDEETDYGSGPGILMAPRVGGTAVDWKKANLALDHRRKQNDIEAQEGTLLVAAELEMPLGATLAALQTKMAQFPDRVARFVTGLRDVQEVADKLRDEMDADLADLNAARYLNLTVGELVAALPFDENTERLLKLVTFDGQDQAALRELIATVALTALAQIGRKTIAQIRARESIGDEDLADSATGQVTDEAATFETARRSSKTEAPSQSLSPPAPSLTEAPPQAVQPKRRPENKRKSNDGPGGDALRIGPRNPAQKQGRAQRRMASAKPATPPRDVEPVKHQARQKRRRPR